MRSNRSPRRLTSRIFGRNLDRPFDAARAEKLLVHRGPGDEGLLIGKAYPEDRLTEIAMFRRHRRLSNIPSKFIVTSSLVLSPRTCSKACLLASCCSFFK